MVDLIGSAEVAAILGVSQRRVLKLAADRRDFPRPARSGGRRKVWRRSAIERWAATADRSPGRPANGPRR